MRPFTYEQKSLIERGEVLNTQLKSYIADALGVNKRHESKRHTFISSGPGAGKTYTTLATAEEHNIKMIPIMGNSTLNNVMYKLAFAEYFTPRGQDIIVWIDDCDTIFSDSKQLNVIKGVLDKERSVFAWNVNLSGQLATLDKSEDPNLIRMAEALRSFQHAGSMGVEIPTDRMRFIITSNRKLIAPNAPKLRTGRANQKLMDESAFRDRVRYKELTQNPKEMWGWLASVALNTEVLHVLSKEQIQELLIWMFDHWNNLSSVSLRAVEELAADMVNHPTDYVDYWESSFLISSEV
jgi:hypothetical protein